MEFDDGVLSSDLQSSDDCHDQNAEGRRGPQKAIELDIDVELAAKLNAPELPGVKNTLVEDDLTGNRLLH